jgi:hypothetical protein
MPIYMPEEKPRELPPPGAHLAVCYMVIDLGTQPGGRFPARRQVLFGFELPEEERSDGQPFTILRRYNYSSNANATLRHDIESWLGRTLTAADFGKLDLTERLGSTCVLGIKHETRDDGYVFANITSVMTPGKSTPKRLPVTNAVMALSLDERPFDRVTFEALPEWVRKAIEASPEYKTATNSAPVVPESTKTRLAAQLAGPQNAVARELDDEIPDFGGDVPSS